MFKVLRGIALAGSLLAMVDWAAGASIEGTVRGPDGKPWQGVDVKLESKSSTAPQMAKTNGSGKYVFNNLGNTDIYSVTVMQGKQTKAFMQNVKAGSPKRLDFDVKQAAAGQAAKKAKHMVWVPADTGSHIGGRWVEATDDGANASGQNIERKSGESIKHTTTYDNPNPRPGG